MKQKIKIVFIVQEIPQYSSSVFPVHEDSKVKKFTDKKTAEKFKKEMAEKYEYIKFYVSESCKI